ncbi:MAG TPA: TrkA C-terminal domain-containing protein [Chloroflexota bacterium]|nr:TrkA C-terminal domain-containing protein [Chloroflexota bacterium]
MIQPHSPEPAPSPDAPERPLVIMVGSGPLARAIAENIGGDWRVLLLDPNASLKPNEHVLPEGAQPDVTIVRADGTSRLVLRRVGAERAGAFVALTADDAVNLEAARLARDIFNIHRVIVVCQSLAAARDAEAMGAEAIDLPLAITQLLQGRLEPTIRPVVGPGMRQGEIVEVTLLPSSPVLGRPLRALGARDWLVGAVYREDRLIIPNGNTCLEAGDRIVLIGSANILPGVADYFRSGVTTFPLPYGRRLAAVATGKLPSIFWDEVEYLRRATRAIGIDVFTAEDLPHDEAFTWHVVEPGRELPDAIASPTSGCLVLPAEELTLPQRLHVSQSLVWRALDRARQPVLIARGTFPYRDLAFAATPDDGAEAAAEVAAGLASLWGESLEVIAAAPPPFVANPRQLRHQREVLAEMLQLGQMRKIHVEERHLTGNPVRTILGAIKENVDLVIVGHRPDGRWTPWNPDIAGEVAVSAPCSALAVPPFEGR